MKSTFIVFIDTWKNNFTRLLGWKKAVENQKCKY